MGCVDLIDTLMIHTQSRPTANMEVQHSTPQGTSIHSNNLEFSLNSSVAYNADVRQAKKISTPNDTSEFFCQCALKNKNRTQKMNKKISTDENFLIYDSIVVTYLLFACGGIHSSYKCLAYPTVWLSVASAA